MVVSSFFLEINGCLSIWLSQTSSASIAIKASKVYLKKKTVIVFFLLEQGVSRSTLQHWLARKESWPSLQPGFLLVEPTARRAGGPGYQC